MVATCLPLHYPSVPIVSTLSETCLSEISTSNRIHATLATVEIVAVQTRFVYHSRFVHVLRGTFQPRHGMFHALRGTFHRTFYTPMLVHQGSLIHSRQRQSDLH
uniref:Uncharacterized protein n=1 Tax=Cacopsylla melanoneura TaxID=428564 RepID=A0A8D8QNR3_9HEMI